ncbi:MAG: hypothetical protein RJQ08_12100 [Salinisphaeraceae bacterium]
MSLPSPDIDERLVANLHATLPTLGSQGVSHLLEDSEKLSLIRFHTRMILQSFHPGVQTSSASTLLEAALSRLGLSSPTHGSPASSAKYLSEHLDLFDEWALQSANLTARLLAGSDSTAPQVFTMHNHCLHRLCTKLDARRAGTQFQNPFGKPIDVRAALGLDECLRYMLLSASFINDTNRSLDNQATEAFCLLISKLIPQAVYAYAMTCGESPLAARHLVPQVRRQLITWWSDREVDQASDIIDRVADFDAVIPGNRNFQYLFGPAVPLYGEFFPRHYHLVNLAISLRDARSRGLPATIGS